MTIEGEESNARWASQNQPEWFRLFPSKKWLNRVRACITVFTRNKITFVLFSSTCILLSSGILIMPGIWKNSVTVVEYVHLPSGLVTWQCQSFECYRVCGPLSKLLYSLPAWAFGVRADSSLLEGSDDRVEWLVGEQFEAHNHRIYPMIYSWSRLLPAVVMMLGGLLIFDWSRRLFGTWPGIVSLGMWCWMPPVLGHGSLITADVISAVLGIVAVRLFLIFLIRPTLASAIICGMGLGLAVGTKFTLIVLIPCWVVLLIARVIENYGKTENWQYKLCVHPFVLFTFGIIMFATCILTLDLLYLFRDIGVPLESFKARSSFYRVLDWMREHAGTAWMLRMPLPVPLEFLRGIDVQLSDTERLQPAYLLGSSKIGGWWYWYVAAICFKTPIPALVLFLLAILRVSTAVRSPGLIRWAGACLMLATAQLTLAIACSTGTGTNAAFRYLLPSLALLCVWVGYLATSKSRFIQATIVGCLLWLFGNAVLACPDHLGWQNECAWMWERWSGRQALIGDSLDWGQDLSRLNDWIAQHSSEGNTQICVYGRGNGETYGLHPPRALPFGDPSNDASFLAVSENMLFGYATGGGCVQIGKRRYSLVLAQREALIQVNTYVRIGRTIRVYRLKNLPSDLFDF